MWDPPLPSQLSSFPLWPHLSARTDFSCCSPAQAKKYISKFMPTNQMKCYEADDTYDGFGPLRLSLLRCLPEALGCCCFALCFFLPGTISGGTMKEIHETTTKRPLGRYVCSSTGVRRRIRLICRRRKIRELIMFWKFLIRGATKQSRAAARLARWTKTCRFI